MASRPPLVPQPHQDAVEHAQLARREDHLLQRRAISICFDPVDEIRMVAHAQKRPDQIHLHVRRPSVAFFPWDRVFLGRRRLLHSEGSLQLVQELRVWYHESPVPQKLLRRQAAMNHRVHQGQDALLDVILHPPEHEDSQETGQEQFGIWLLPIAKALGTCEHTGMEEIQQGEEGVDVLLHHSSGQNRRPAQPSPQGAERHRDGA
mmetsp:Transcript_10510/g.39658  ORF Transcript_10510/g.39658 Transcript_10510/m.39658 type:complete len:205 (+) Transcript_10510:3536-4150(+)|eukprot:scaffold327_cov257-Pinguiococcus_pyrenoidosus.AAC.34